MLTITLPDGSKRQYPMGTTGLTVAESISPSLAKAALALKVDGEGWDLLRPLPGDCSVEILTLKSPESLDLLRHDAAHVLAEAAKELFPDVQVTIGPAIENGFYYDFHREKSFTPEDLVLLEERMHQIVDRDEKITRDQWARDKAISYFEGIGERFKAEIIRDLPEEVSEVSVYTQGAFTDLCRGPHLPSTSKLPKAFKLTKLAGAYWRGDSSNPMLQRVYGTAWRDKKELDAYLTQLEEAEKRDHRKLGRALDLFHFDDIAQGIPFWHPKGWTVFRILQSFIRQVTEANGYKEVNTPILLDRKLWEMSGHWEKFREHMFLSESEKKILAMKPMSCPGAIEIFKQGNKSYRDLPLRLSEFGCCHRNESTGALHGLLRVRAMTQDDGHIFCTEDQILSETQKFCEMLQKAYKALGFDEIVLKLADRPAVRAGEDALWDKAEASLKDAINACGLPWTLNPGDGAFYGPKLEFYLKDAIGRMWQCGTFQLDFVLPQRLEATYVGEDGEKHHPVMLHRAILGTLERFIGILIENYAGSFPFWLAPLQVVVATVTNDADGYAQKVYDDLVRAGLRAELDTRNEQVSYKIREHSHQKIPVIMVVGKKEMEEQTVAIRFFGDQGQKVLPLAQAIEDLLEKSQIKH